VVGHVLALQVEGHDAVLTILIGAEQSDDADLLHVGADVDTVVAGHQEEIVDVEGADLLVVYEVGEADVSLLQSDPSQEATWWENSQYQG